MRIAIMQPTYLPWCGYFALIEQVDCFVLLDDVAFQKQSWQQRNRIINTGELQWLTVPVRSKPLGTPIVDMEISLPGFANKHWRALEHCYQGSPYFSRYADAIEETLKSERNSLCTLNSSLIRLLCQQMEIQTEIVSSTSLGVGGLRGGHVAQICQALGAQQYLTPVGAVEYLQKDQSEFIGRDIEVFVQEFSHPVYTQRKTPFVPFASAVDLLFQVGPETKGHLQAGTTAPGALSWDQPPKQNQNELQRTPMEAVA